MWSSDLQWVSLLQGTPAEYPMKETKEELRRVAMNSGLLALFDRELEEALARYLPDAIVEYWRVSNLAAQGINDFSGQRRGIIVRKWLLLRHRDITLYSFYMSLGETFVCSFLFVFKGWNHKMRVFNLLVLVGWLVYSVWRREAESGVSPACLADHIIHSIPIFN